MSKFVVKPMCQSCTKSCKESCFKKRFGFSSNPEFQRLFEKMVEISGSPLVIMASKGYRGCSLVIEVGFDE